jgi:hypothetical protein
VHLIHVDHEDTVANLSGAGRARMADTVTF